MQLDFRGDISEAPYDTKLLVLLNDSTIHTAIKTSASRGSFWFPVGVEHNDIGSTCWFVGDVCGWIDLDDLVITG